MHVAGFTASPLATAIAAAIVFLILVGLIALAVHSFRRTARLKRRYGTDYARAVQKFGSRRKAERELQGREARVRTLDIRPLTPKEREQFAERWDLLQSHFVDSPAGALGEADGLICSVMKSRGYPASGFDDCAAGIFVNHPQVAEDFRAARAATVPSTKHPPTTEELRTALIHYRALFNELAGPLGGSERKAA